jgi:hypothetical protein
MPLWNGDVANESHLYPHSSELAADGSTAHGGHHASESLHLYLMATCIVSA